MTELSPQRLEQTAGRMTTQASARVTRARAAAECAAAAERVAAAERAAAAAETLHRESLVVDAPVAESPPRWIHRDGVWLKLAGGFLSAAGESPAEVRARARRRYGQRCLEGASPTSAITSPTSVIASPPAAPTADERFDARARGVHARIAQLLHPRRAPVRSGDAAAPSAYQIAAERRARDLSQRAGNESEPRRARHDGAARGVAVGALAPLLGEQASPVAAELCGLGRVAPDDALDADAWARAFARYDRRVALVHLSVLEELARATELVEAPGEHALPVWVVSQRTPRFDDGAPIPALPEVEPFAGETIWSTPGKAEFADSQAKSNARIARMRQRPPDRQDDAECGAPGGLHPYGTFNPRLR